MKGSALVDFHLCDGEVINLNEVVILLVPDVKRYHLGGLGYNTNLKVTKSVVIWLVPNVKRYDSTFNSCSFIKLASILCDKSRALEVWLVSFSLARHITVLILTMSPV